MQLILIVHLSIAMLASELSGVLPIGPAWGLAILGLAPALAVATGAWMNRAAQRGMDRQDQSGIERAFASSARIGACVALVMLVASGTELPVKVDGTLGHLATIVLFLGVAVSSTLAHHAMLYPIERRLREARLMRSLDSGAPVHPTPTRGAYLLARARASMVPLLAPILIMLALGEGARLVALRVAPGSADAIRVAGSAAGVLCLFVLFPLLVPFLLGLRRLEPGPIRSDLEEMAASAGVGVREIWVWPTDGLIANAAVVGMLPGLRCVMFSDGLLEGMSRRHIRAVMAHELGHVVRRHMLWLAVVLVALGLVVMAAVEPLASEVCERLAVGADGDAQRLIKRVVSISTDVSIFAIAITLFGYASRRFERQADTFAVQLMSRSAGRDDATSAAVDDMCEALRMIAYLNHVPVARGSWRHGSIAWRMRYLRLLDGAPLASMWIDRQIALICWGSAAIVAAAAALELNALEFMAP